VESHAGLRKPNLWGVGATQYAIGRVGPARRNARLRRVLRAAEHYSQ